MTRQTEPDRCRLVLVIPPAPEDGFAERLRAALAGGDVASVILPADGRDEAAFQALAEQLVPVVQQAGAAAVIAGDSRIAGRVQADGIQIDGDAEALADAVERAAGRMIVGAGGAETRDAALDLGEARPDYMLFGRLGHDQRPEPHPRNLELARWWAEMIEIPCIVAGGSDIASVTTVAATGAEFVALSTAVFGPGVDPGAAVARANALLDETAPRFRGTA